MNITAIVSKLSRWPLSRILVLMLAGAFAGLMMDIRVEHVDVVRERSIAWVPIIYSGCMMLSCLAACVFWNEFIRRVMIALFLLAFVIGGTGVYLHNHGQPIKVITNSIKAWTDPDMSHSDGPPRLAPMAFAGLGMIGILACLNRFNP